MPIFTPIDDPASSGSYALGMDTNRLLSVCIVYVAMRKGLQLWQLDRRISNTYHEEVAAYRVPPAHPPGGLGFLKLESATCFQDVASHADLLTVLEWGRREHPFRTLQPGGCYFLFTTFYGLLVAGHVKACWRFDKESSFQLEMIFRSSLVSILTFAGGVIFSFSFKYPFRIISVHLGRRKLPDFLLGSFIFYFACF